MNFEKVMFSHIYDRGIDAQKNRYQRLFHAFQNRFDSQAIQIFSTPGRTEISGNHTDHNHGRVLAASVDLDSIGMAVPTGSTIITLYSQGYPDPFMVDIHQLEPQEKERGSTAALIRGIAAHLAGQGYQTGGFNAFITSDVMPGSGLSSSASIEVLIGTMISHLFNQGKVPNVTLALAGQAAENQFYGKPCGLMDQIACAWGGIVSIDFKNPTQPQVKPVNFDFSQSGYRLVFVDTGGDHADLTDDYAAIPREMKAVARALGSDVCRDLTHEMLTEQMPALREKLGDRALIRVLHFLNENHRVARQVQCLESNDMETFLKLVKASGDSSFKYLQNIFSPKQVKRQPLSLGLAISEAFISQTSRGAVRVHGGGFAGTIQAFIPHEAVAEYQQELGRIFGEERVKILSIRKSGTIRVA